MATFNAYVATFGGAGFGGGGYSLGEDCEWVGEVTARVMPYVAPVFVNAYKPAFDAPILIDWSGDPLEGYGTIDIVGTPSDRSVHRLARLALATLLTWRRADPADELPHEGHPLLGWWAETVDPDNVTLNGSRLWLLKRAVLTAGTVERIREYCVEAFDAWIEQGIARAVDVVAQRNGASRVDVVITITEPDGARTPLRFPWLWEAIRNA